MTPKSTTPPATPLKVRLDLLTRAGLSLLRAVPLGGAMGVVVAGVVLWRAPGIVPAGWTAEAVLSLGMALGVVVHRLLDAVLGWLVEPMVRHLGARWEAAIQLGKLARYRKRGLIPDGEARELTGRIVRADVTPRRPRRK